MKLWIGNIAPGTTDDELRALLAKYGAPEVVSISQEPGDGTRPAAVLELAAGTQDMQRLTERLNGMYWKGRALMVQAMTR